jgi:hypothetical protein
MDNKKYLWAGLTLLLLTSLFIAVQSVMATTPTLPGTFCGDSGVGGDSVLRVKKNVYCEFATSWVWNILKSADQTNLPLGIGETATVNYTVTASAVATSNYSVAGLIRITNITANPIWVNTVDDSLGPVSACYVGGTEVSLPFPLNGYNDMVCLYSGNQTTAPSQNVATVNYGADVETGATASINWSGVTPTETDECVDISDTFAGALGTVCAGTETSFTLNYSRTIGPYEVCGEYTVPNTASLLTNDTGATDSSNWTVNVNVECEEEGEGCTPGFWRQDQHFDSWVGYDPDDDFEVVFGVDASFDPHTLGDAVLLGGGGEYALARHAVAALLNAASPDVDYPYTEAEVIAMVQAAYASGDFESAKDVFEAANEAFCPLD